MDKEKVVFSRKIDWYVVVLRVLVKWKILICVGIVSVGVCATLSYVKSHMTARELKQSQGAEIILTQDEMDDIEVYIEQKKLMEHQRIYNEKSYFMNLNPEQYFKGVLCYYIKNTDDEEQDNQELLFTSIKENLLNSKELKSQVSILVEEDTFMQTYSEIIDVNNVLTEDETNTNSNAGLYIVVRHNEEQVCKELLTCVKDYMDNNWKNASCVSESVDPVLDVALIEYQKNQINTMSAYMNTIDGLKAKFSDKQKSYIARLDSEREDVTYSVGISLKLVIVGTIVILMGIILLWVVYYLISDRVYVEDELKEFQDAMVLGIIKKKGNRGRFYNEILKRCRCDFNIDENERISIMLQKLCQKMQTEEVIIVGESEKDIQAQLILINNNLKESGIEIKIKSRLTDRDILLGDKKNPIVMLVETDVEKHRNLELLAEFAYKNSLEISGIIMID